VPPPTPQRPWWRRKAEKTDEDDGNDYLGVLFPFLQSSGSVLKTALGVGVGLGTGSLLSDYLPLIQALTNIRSVRWRIVLLGLVQGQSSGPGM
jgi:hypothetical protein